MYLENLTDQSLIRLEWQAQEARDGKLLAEIKQEKNKRYRQI